MSCILFDSFTCSDADEVERKITNEKFYKELTVLEGICATKGQTPRLQGNVSLLGQGLHFSLLFD